MRSDSHAGLCLALLGAVVAASLCSCAQATSSITSTRYALVYGIEDYPGTIYDLTYTKDDADSMAALLGTEGWTVSESTDSSATRARVVSDIASVASSASSDSTVLIYYSGHGTLENGVTYILPYDSIVASNVGTRDESISLDAGSALSQSDLSTLISTLPTKNVIIILDSCYSGGFVDSGSSIDASPSSYATMEKYSAFATALANFDDLLVSNASATGDKTPIVISAAGSGESSYDGSESMGHGVFTYYLLKSSDSGDSDGDGVVTTTEAFAYTTEYIKAWDSKLTAHSGEDPFLPHISGGTRDLVLFSN
jgi:uncharacterized caspase-like protein